MIGRLQLSGAEIRLNTEITPELAKEIGPDVIVAALGAKPNFPDFMMCGSQNVMMALDVFTNLEKVGQRVVIVGGGLVGCELSLQLAQLGKQVTVIDRKKEVCRDASFLFREGLLMELEKVSVTIRSNTSCLSVDNNEITIQTDREEPVKLFADTIIAATVFSPLDDETEQFRELSYDFWKIGDCFRVRTLFNARREGYNAGVHI